MKKIILLLLLCLLLVFSGCKKAAVDVPQPVDSTDDGQGGDLSQDLSNVDALEDEISLDDELDEDFLNNLDW